MLIRGMTPSENAKRFPLPLGYSPYLFFYEKTARAIFQPWNS